MLVFVLVISSIILLHYSEKTSRVQHNGYTLEVEHAHLWLFASKCDQSTQLGTFRFLITYVSSTYKFKKST